MNMERDRDPRLVVVSGPSGVGKTTVVRRLYELCGLPLVAGVSATTRPPRPGEVDGVDYYFLEADDFQRRRENGDFIECFDVFGRGYWYGTLKSEVDRALDEGNWMVLEIDVQGAAQVMQLYASAITIFVLPGSEEELERRLPGDLQLEARGHPQRKLAGHPQVGRRGGRLRLPHAKARRGQDGAGGRRISSCSLPGCSLPGLKLRNPPEHRFPRQGAEAYLLDGPRSDFSRGRAGPVRRRALR